MLFHVWSFVESSSWHLRLQIYRTNMRLKSKQLTISKKISPDALHIQFIISLIGSVRKIWPFLRLFRKCVHISGWKYQKWPKRRRLTVCGFKHARVCVCASAIFTFPTLCLVTHHSTKLRENVKSTPFAAMSNNYIWQIIWKFSREKDIWNNRKIHLI